MPTENREQAIPSVSFKLCLLSTYFPEVRISQRGEYFMGAFFVEAISSLIMFLLLYIFLSNVDEEKE